MSAFVLLNAAHFDCYLAALHHPLALQASDGQRLMATQSEPHLDCDLEADTLCPAPSTSSPASPNPSTPDVCFGDYVIESELARGGMGVIYVAHHRVMKRRVAIKTLCTGLSRSGGERERLVAEAEASAQLDHPGIVPVYAVGETQNEPYLVMKLIKGENLAQRLQRGPLSIEEATQLGISLAQAVHHAHQRGVIHRDLKPANILLDAEHNHRPVITDFGIAKLVQSIRQRMTSANEPIGTPHFMPPEQADQTRGAISPASDVYSLGAVLYTALTGRPPFQAASAVDVVFQLLTKEPVAPRRLNATIPATLDAIVMKCLEKAPARRYQSASALAHDLSCFANGQPTVARPMSWTSWGLYQLRRHLLIATVSGSLVSLLLIACFVVAVLYWQSQYELMRLQQQVVAQQNVLTTERLLFRKQLSKVQQREIGQTEFDASRLADYAKHVSKSNSLLATRLALESLKLSRQDSLAGDPFCIQWLQQIVDQPHSADTSTGSAQPVDTLITQAEAYLAAADETALPSPTTWLGVDTDPQVTIQPKPATHSSAAQQTREP